MLGFQATQGLGLVGVEALGSELTITALNLVPGVVNTLDSNPAFTASGLSFDCRARGYARTYWPVIPE